MKSKGILNHVFSKIVLAFLLVVSMITPLISVTSASAEMSITVDEAIEQYVVGASKNISVEGYIVGFVVSETSVTGTATSNTNYAIA